MTSGPLLCPLEKKAELEARNGVEQLDYLSHLVNEYQIKNVRESHVLELHSIAIQDIYPCGGTYRDARHQVFIEGSGHVVPEPARIPMVGRHRRCGAPWCPNSIVPQRSTTTEPTPTTFRGLRASARP